MAPQGASVLSNPPSFLELSAEIRIKIYLNLCARATVQVFALEADEESLELKTSERRSCIILPCRLCYNEARPILYKTAK